MIKTVILDIGNVLMFFNYDKMFRQVGEFCGMHADDVYHELIEKQLGIQYELGNITTSDLFDHFAKKATQPLKGYEEFKLAITDIFIPNSSLYPLVKALKRQNLRLFLLSNTCEAHFDYMLMKYPILEEFECYILSYKTRSRKPNMEIFSEAIRLAGCRPEECFYTDDIYEYVLGARDMGIDAELFTDSLTLRKMLSMRGIRGL